jgi:alkanesulfonate monooxygenase SsuD/methylene tetrahydromethanopterin reductase-like flavin-dependent oxidoreductase (luciferase family)
MADVRARCEAAGRDPASLRFSVYTRDEEYLDPGQQRVDRIAAFAEIGLDRLICFPTKRQPTLEAQARFAEDCRAAGVQLA